MQYLLGLRGIKTVIVYDREIEKTDSARMLELVRFVLEGFFETARKSPRGCDAKR